MLKGPACVHFMAAAAWERSSFVRSAAERSKRACSTAAMNFSCGISPPGKARCGFGFALGGFLAGGARRPGAGRERLPAAPGESTARHGDGDSGDEGGCEDEDSGRAHAEWTDPWCGVGGGSRWCGLRREETP